MSSLGKGQRVASDDLMTASDWEARLDEARARREEVLAKRKQMPDTPSKPWLEAGAENLTKHDPEELIDEAKDGAVAKYRQDEPGISRFTEKVQNLKPQSFQTDEVATERLSVASVAAAERQRKASRRDLLPDLEPAVIHANGSAAMTLGRLPGLGLLSSSFNYVAVAVLLALLPRPIGDAAVPSELELLSAPPSITVPLVSASASDGPNTGSFEQPGIAEVRLATLSRTDFPPFIGPVGIFPRPTRADASDLSRTDLARVIVETEIAHLPSATASAGSLDVAWPIESEAVAVASTYRLAAPNTPDLVAVVPKNPSPGIAPPRDYAWSNGEPLVSAQDVAPILAPLSQSVRPRPAPDWSAPAWQAELTNVSTVSPTIWDGTVDDLSSR